MADCLFCQIVAGDVPAHMVLDAPDVVAFLDARPVFKGHVLIVPRVHYETLMHLPEAQVGPLFTVAQRVGSALQHALEADGVFIGINNVISQSVPHLHIHAVPRRHKDGLRGFFWPRLKYASEDEAADYAARIAAAV